ncbi:MAG: flagellar biosynthesis protein FlhF [Treponema sp.]|jgi:flagellar biosynthesis protein FlhF|nr:flagellar biosynthesis protein FlhF [Treponema sp.]
MDTFTEQALTYIECVKKIHAKYGVQARILTYKSIRMGGFLGLFAKEGVEIAGYIPNSTGKNLSSLMGMSGPGPSNFTGSAGASGSLNLSVPAGTSHKISDFEEEKKKIIAAAGRDPTMQLLLKEVQSIKEKIDTNAGSSRGREEEHPNLNRIQEILDLNDFSPSYSEGILDRIKKEKSLDELNDYDTLQDTVLEWIGESIALYHEKKQRTRPRIMVLVGPTGVGKTTTIAKLAAIFGVPNLRKSPLSVRLITIDAFRIGARQQIETYGELMELPVSYVDNHDDLKKTIAMHSGEVDLILVDTIGNSPRDSMKLGEMKLLLDACGSQAEIHLALAATTKSSDLKEILRQFEPFDYRSVVITKLDETIRVGNVISALADRGKPVSYITDGQKVPHDIKKAQVVHFLTNLEGFRVNRAKIEKRFPEDINEQIFWR